MSDLISNTIRGVLAEYIVARAVGASTIGVRDPWAAFDLETLKESRSKSSLQVMCRVGRKLGSRASALISRRLVRGTLRLETWRMNPKDKQTLCICTSGAQGSIYYRPDES